MFLKNNYYNATVTNFKINNICGATSISPINLTLLAKTFIYPLITKSVSTYETTISSCKNIL
jgi:hypothetical protein